MSNNQGQPKNVVAALRQPTQPTRYTASSSCFLSTNTSEHGRLAAVPVRNLASRAGSACPGHCLNVAGLFIFSKLLGNFAQTFRYKCHISNKRLCSYSYHCKKKTTRQHEYWFTIGKPRVFGIPVVDLKVQAPLQLPRLSLPIHTQRVLHGS